MNTQKKLDIKSYKDPRRNEADWESYRKQEFNNSILGPVDCGRRNKPKPSADNQAYNEQE